MRTPRRQRTRGRRVTCNPASARQRAEERAGHIFLLLAIFTLAFIIRLLPVEEYHGWDESIYLQHAERIASGKDNYDELSIRPPLWPIIIAGGYRLWHSQYMASVLIALLSASITVAMFFIGRRLHSAEAGLFAALLVAVHPLFVRFGHLLLTDALVASLLAFALLFALERRWWATLAAGAFLGLAGLAKFTGLGALPALLGFVAYNAWHDVADQAADRRKGRAWLRSVAFNVAARAGSFLLGFAIVFTPYLLWARAEYGSFLKVFQSAQAIVNNPHGGPLHYLSIVVFTVPLLFGLVLLIWQWRSARRERTLVFALLAIVWAAIIIAYLSTFPNKEHRYALAAIVPLAALAGIGYAAALAWLRRKVSFEAAYAAVALAIIGFVALSLGSFSRLTEPTLNHYQQPPVEMALRISALNDSAAIIYATSDYPIYGYYTNNRVVVVDGPRFLDAYPRIMPRDGYLVINKLSTREPTVAWADAQPELTRISENEHIVLYAYDNPRFTLEDTLS